MTDGTKCFKVLASLVYCMVLFVLEPCSFDRVWVVFDKDDFDDFNDAIKKAHKLGFQSAHE